MGKMLHNEARELLVESYEKTHNAEEIAKIFGVNKYTVYHMAERKRKTGSVALRTSQRGRKQLLNDEDKQHIRQCIDETPDITPAELRAKPGLKASIQTLSRAVRAMGYRVKKESMSASEQERHSPDMNPIEMLWSKVKALLRKRECRTAELLPKTVSCALLCVSQRDCVGWFKADGYCL